MKILDLLSTYNIGLSCEFPCKSLLVLHPRAVATQRSQALVQNDTFMCAIQNQTHYIRPLLCAVEKASRNLLELSEQNVNYVAKLLLSSIIQIMCLKFVSAYISSE